MQPGLANANALGGGKVQSTLPAPVIIKITKDLPNGPYGQMSGMNMEMFLHPDMTYQQAKDEITKAWTEGRGSMMNMAFQGPTGASSSYKEEWILQEITFKGGPVNMEAAVQEGDHMVSMGLTQNVTRTNCCSIS
eukprot:TRINITY_DN20763_c0_g1_i1.p1 TRINITY_DN20763_c0_g1~~TRINITY_DN20763_c0_g1_i1.p1  ORF type:complete len:135 (+),score=23.86 TRINITY_DN20763_c0_g1_i1:92-496(+)